MSVVFGQDIRFSQFDLNPLYLNPAYAGSASDLVIGGNYRNQWFNVPGKTIPGAISSYNLSLNKRFGNVLVGGIGFNAFQSYKGEGFYKHNHFGFSYSWHMPLQTENLNIYFGTGVAYNQLGVDFNRLTFSDQISATQGYLNTPSSFIPQINGRKSYLDINTGIVLKGNISKSISTEFSFAADHLTKPNISLNNLQESLPIKYSTFGSISFKVKKDKLYINPKILIENQNPFNTYTVGFNMYVVNRYFYAQTINYSKPLYWGLYYQTTKFELSNTNSLIFLAGHTGKFGSSNTRYQIGASYDFSVGGLNFRSRGTGEISMNVIFDTQTNLKKRSKKQTKCKQFQGNPLSPLI
ncbi:MAG: PorP/SprF family type IX secretion system membrane protein [Chitinophagales bacterium]|nr:PorP/SprF family type IX secretion system membrane protein [Chitinophagales bacterium]